MAKPKKSSKPLPSGGEILLYQTEDGGTRIQCRFQDESIWLTQKLLAELFQKDVRTINEHIQNIYEEQELAPEATIRKFRIVQMEGEREVAREVDHYRLEAILAVGFRVRSQRGTQFRQWAISRLEEYLRKGFTMDDERLKNSPSFRYLNLTRDSSSPNFFTISLPFVSTAGLRAVGRSLRRPPLLIFRGVLSEQSSAATERRSDSGRIFWRSTFYLLAGSWN